MKVFRVGERIIDEDGCKGTIEKINSSEEVVKYYGTPMYNVSHDVDENGRKTSADGWYKADKLMSIEKFIPTIEDTTEMKPFSIGYLKNGTTQSIVVMAHNQDDAYLYFAVNKDYDRIYGTTQLYQSTYKQYRRRGMPEITVDYKEINQGKEKRGYNYEINEILNHDAEFRYQLLDRMKMDCNYYLGNGNRHDKYLWAGNVTEQIQYMKDLWKSFPDDAKPEWLTWEQICKYEKSMTNDNEINIIDNSDMELDEPEI